MNEEALKIILKNHEKWLNGEGGERANLEGADLRIATLKDVNLEGSDLRGANLRGATLKDVNLRGSDLIGANLRGANLDFSCLPLWCGGLNMHIDDRIFKQLLYHTLQNALYSKNISENIKEDIRRSGLLKYANESHVVTEHKKDILS